jgi:hypothetical protein
MVRSACGEVLSLPYRRVSFYCEAGSAARGTRFSAAR